MIKYHRYQKSKRMVKQKFDDDHDDHDDHKSIGTTIVANSTKSILCIAIYMILWISYAITIHATGRLQLDSGNVKIPPSLMILWVEIIKFTLAGIMFFFCSPSSSITTISINSYCQRSITAIASLLWSYTPIAFCYTIVHNLSVPNQQFLDPTTFILLVSSIKLVATTIVWNIIFGKTLSHQKWKALGWITMGSLIKAVMITIIFVKSKNQGSSHKEIPNKDEYAQSLLNHVIYLLIQIGFGVLAGVYNEKVLKQGGVSITSLFRSPKRTATTKTASPLSPYNDDPHVHNLCLYALGILFNGIAFYYHYSVTGTHDDNDERNLFSFHLFQNLPRMHQYSILLLAMAGVSTSFVLKHVDSIAKAMATAMEPAIISILSFIIFGYPVPLYQICSMVLIGYGIYQYYSDESDNVNTHDEPRWQESKLCHSEKRRRRKRKRIFHCLLIITIIGIAIVQLKHDYYKYSMGERKYFTRMKKDKVEEEICQTLAPECQSLSIIEKQWSYSKYNQSQCCLIHPYLRYSIMQIWSVLQDWNVTAWMESGSALGLARHNFTQVPWETDADIAMVVSTTEEDYDGSHPKFIKYENAQEWMERLVKTLNTQEKKHRRKITLFNLLPIVKSHWRYKIHLFKRVTKGDNCIQIQLFQDINVKQSSENITTHVDLFGWVQEEYNEEDYMNIDDMLMNDDEFAEEDSDDDGNGKAFSDMNRKNDRPELNSTKNHNNTHPYYLYYGTCYHRNHNTFGMHVYPPKRCQFYDHWVWCPRDLITYLKTYYGPNVLEEGQSHAQVYGW